MNNLPNDIIYVLLTHLNLNHGYNLALVNKKYYHMFAENVMLWGKYLDGLDDDDMVMSLGSDNSKLTCKIYKSVEYIRKTFKIDIKLTDMYQKKTLVHGVDNVDLICVPRDIHVFKNLQNLMISTGSIKYIPNELFMLTNLQELNLGFNSISVIPNAIGDLTNLKNLCFNRNMISIIPPTISKLTNLTEARFDNNIIKTIPKDIYRLTKLTRLDLDHNEIIEIHCTITNLVNLRTLYLHDNMIIKCPTELNKLNLETLYLTGNNFTVTHDMFSLLNLRWFDFKLD